MKINFQMSGGFAHIPGLSKPITVDTQKIDPRVANELESFVRSSGFFDQAPRTDIGSKGAADYRIYTITVEDGALVHTVKLTDPIEDANLQRLVSRLQALMREPKS